MSAPDEQPTPTAPPMSAPDGRPTPTLRTHAPKDRRR